MDTQQEEYEQGVFSLKDIPSHLRKYFEPKPIFDFEPIARELYRVTKQGGVVVWVVGDATIKGSETGTSFRQALYFKEIGFNLHDTMIYEKAGSAYPETVRYYQFFEYMFVFSKGKPKTINLIEDRENKWGGTLTFGKSSNRKADGSLKQRSEKRMVKEIGVRANMWRYSNGYGYCATDAFAHDHPAPFPEALARDHILSWSNEGDTVLDPFAGSGTTGKMALLHNRNFIGMEISAEYLEIARRRVGLVTA